MQTGDLSLGNLCTQLGVCKAVGGGITLNWVNSTHQANMHPTPLASATYSSNQCVRGVFLGFN